jgi:hypothetical protein
MGKDNIYTVVEEAALILGFMDEDSRKSRIAAIQEQVKQADSGSAGQLLQFLGMLTRNYMMRNAVQDIISKLEMSTQFR